jgi:hypothetical protein
MKTLTIQVTEQDYTLMCLRLIEPQAHLQNCAETMLHHAMQEHGYTQAADGHYSEEDIKQALAKPSAAKREADRAAKQKADEAAAMSAKEIRDAADKKAAAEQATKQAEQDALQAERRQADVSSAAKALLADAMPELRKSVMEQLRAEAAAVKKP